MLRASSGITGLDEVLSGGWPAGRLFLVEGCPGTGKTTLGFQFLLEASRRGERVLYITLSETRGEVEAVAHEHGWSLEGIEIFDLEAAEKVLGLHDGQRMFDPSDVEFRATSRAILDELERVSPTRLVFDSLSELSFLARDHLTFRHELLMLKRATTQRGATVLLVSDGTAPYADRQLHSLAHGVLELEEMALEYGPERRRLRIRKLRGTSFRGGFHDFTIQPGGIEVYPRLIASEHAREHSKTPLASGKKELDDLLGGGIARGASTLFMGPAGTGKSSLVSLFAHASLERGEPATVFLFDERIDSFLDRADSMGMPLRRHVESGLLDLLQIDPAQMSPGEFVHRVREAVRDHGARFVGIDSLNGYIYAMPEERFLAVQMHELLTYLGQMGVATCLVLAQAGLVGQMTSPADVTYIADSVVLLRFFEAAGQIHRAISMLKKRSGAHGTQLRELHLDQGVRVGPPLEGFQGVLTGTPQFIGSREALVDGTGPADAR